MYRSRKYANDMLKEAIIEKIQPVEQKLKNQPKLRVISGEADRFQRNTKVVRTWRRKDGYSLKMADGQIAHITVALR